MSSNSPPMFNPLMVREAAVYGRVTYYRTLAALQVEALTWGAWWAGSPIEVDRRTVAEVGSVLDRWHGLPGAEHGFSAGVAAVLPWPRGGSAPAPADHTSVIDGYVAALIQTLLFGLAESAVADESSGRHSSPPPRTARRVPRLHGRPLPVHAGVALAAGELTTDEQISTRDNLMGSGVELVASLGQAVPHVCDMAGLARFEGVRVLVLIVHRHYRPDAPTTEHLAALHASGLPITALYLDGSGGAEDDQVRTSVRAGALRSLSSALVLDPRAPIPGGDIAAALLRAVSA